MNRAEYEKQPATITAKNMDAEEFEYRATLAGWDMRTIKLMLLPPLMSEPFQMGRWMVTLIENQRT